MFWKRIFAEKRTPLCVGCAFAHVEVGYSDGEEGIFCGFGGRLRALPFAVGACSDFRDKTDANLRVVSGFVRAGHRGRFRRGCQEIDAGARVQTRAPQACGRNMPA